MFVNSSTVELGIVYSLALELNTVLFCETVISLEFCLFTASVS